MCIYIYNHPYNLCIEDKREEEKEEDEREEEKLSDGIHYQRQEIRCQTHTQKPNECVRWFVKWLID